MLYMVLRAVVILLALLGVSALAVWLYHRYYRKRINRALESDTPVIAPSPALHTVWKVILVLAFLTAVCVWEIQQSNDLDQLRQSCESMSYMVSRTWDTVKKSDARLQEMQTNFQFFEFETTKLDVEAQTVDVSIRALPKEEYTDATVSLRYGADEVALERGQDGVYTAAIQMDPFQLPEANYGTLCLTENGRTKTETVYFHPDVWSYFPRPELNFFDTEIKQKKNVLTIETDVYVPSPDREVRSLRLLVKQNDSTLDDIDLTDSTVGSQFEAHLEKEYPNNATIEFVLQWEDEYGLRHESKRYVIQPSSTEITMPDGDDYYFDGSNLQYRDCVYASDGTLLGELR